MSDQIDPIATLLRYVAAGEAFVAEQHWRFAGKPAQHTQGLAQLEETIGYKIPAEVAAFISHFGGTELFIGEYGHGVTIFPLPEIAARNTELQSSGGNFFPEFLIFGYDQMDDMLCLHKKPDGVHFGNLHHEAWGEPELWVTEALTIYPFSPWLKSFVDSGRTLL
jgi:hypothetical protein